jgi:hypothetical protein
MESFAQAYDLIVYKNYFATAMSQRDIFRKCSNSFTFKEGENIALTLHFVQPHEYI